MTQLNPGPLDTAAVEKIYQQILDESIRIQVQHGLGKAELAEARPRSNRQPKRGKLVSA